jgi:hypothetical protein
MHDRQVSVYGGDCIEKLPYPSESFTSAVHMIVLASMGLPILDWPSLTELAATCERLQRWDYLLTTAPLRLPGAASPINPLCISETRYARLSQQAQNRHDGPLLPLSRGAGRGDRSRIRGRRHGRTQAKLRVSAPGDARESRADRAADAVMRMSGPTAWRAEHLCPGSATPLRRLRRGTP